MWSCCTGGALCPALVEHHVVTSGACAQAHTTSERLLYLSLSLSFPFPLKCMPKGIPMKDPLQNEHEIHISKCTFCPSPSEFNFVFSGCSLLPPSHPLSSRCDPPNASLQCSPPMQSSNATLQCSPPNAILSMQASECNRPMQPYKYNPPMQPSNATLQCNPPNATLPMHPTNATLPMQTSQMQSSQCNRLMQSSQCNRPSENLPM